MRGASGIRFAAAAITARFGLHTRVLVLLGALGLAGLPAAPAARADDAPAAPIPDPRAPVVREGAGLPARAVGLVRRELGAGSGAIVGRCMVVTSEHVISRGGTVATSVGDSVTFYAGTGSVEGTFAEWARAEVVALGPRRTTGAHGDDWALLRLDRPLGDRYGVLPVAIADAGALRTRALWSLGFPGAGAPNTAGYRELGSHRNCRGVHAEGMAWLTTCGAVAGQSGGPVLMPVGDGRIALVAIMTATRRPPPLGTVAAAGDPVTLSVVTAAAAFVKPLREALAAPCPEGDAPAPR